MTQSNLDSRPPLLVFDNQRFATVALAPHDPASFWRATAKTPALCVWDTFTQAVVAKAKTSGSSGIVKVPYADLSRSTISRELLAAPDVGDHDPSRLSQIIASMITAQQNGELIKDELLTNGKANLFPCGSRLVYVNWEDLDLYWEVSAWSPDSVVRAGCRVFSGNLIY